MHFNLLLPPSTSTQLNQVDFIFGGDMMECSRIGISTASFCLWEIDSMTKLRICKELGFTRIEIGLSTGGIFLPLS